MINIAKRVKGIVITDVIISSVRTEVGSIGKPPHWKEWNRKQDKQPNTYKESYHFPSLSNSRT
ncbi:MAG TPA: hypothetical protein VKA95_01115 [Nitrososphaeraceae archaeon]|nr:hypothetical protein [Nitrososphaeraceae archaeon]